MGSKEWASVITTIGCIFLLTLQCFASSNVLEELLPSISEPNTYPLFSSSSPIGDIPIFDSFEDLEPIFHKKNDTTYVINFWATWCKPCVEELPYFEQLQKQYQNDKVKIVLVSLDFKNQLESRLLPFIKEHKLKSEVVVLTDSDANTWINKVDPRWGGAIPVTIIYKAETRQFIEEPFASYEELHSVVKSLR